MPDPHPRGYHGFYSAKADRAFGYVCIYESPTDPSGEVRCTVVGTPDWIAAEYRWSDTIDLGPVGEHLRNEVTDVAQKAAHDEVFGLRPWTDQYDPDQAIARLDRMIAACQLAVSGVSLREAIRTVEHGDIQSN